VPARADPAGASEVRRAPAAPARASRPAPAVRRAPVARPASAARRARPALPVASHVASVGAAGSAAAADAAATRWEPGRPRVSPFRWRWVRPEPPSRPQPEPHTSRGAESVAAPGEWHTEAAQPRVDVVAVRRHPGQSAVAGRERPLSRRPVEDPGGDRFDVFVQVDDLAAAPRAYDDVEVVVDGAPHLTVPKHIDDVDVEVLVTFVPGGEPPVGDPDPEIR